MDSPILPEPEDDEGGKDRRLRPRYMPHPDVLRIAAGLVVLAGSIVGLVTRLEATHRPVTTVLPPVSHVVYGEPTLAALRPASDLSSGARRVCTDELRPQPRSGAWRCTSWQTLALDEIGVQAADPGGPCTHRTTANGARAWHCRTRIAIPEAALHMPYRIPVFFGDLQRGNGIDQKRVPGVCWLEVRASPEARWRCGEWRPLLPGFRALQAVDPGGPCVSRTVDEETGVWWCMSRT